MFNFFKKSKNLTIKNLVWKTESNKNAEIIKAVETSEKNILVYFFEDTKAEIIKQLNGIEYAETITAPKKIILIAAEKLITAVTLPNAKLIFIEHHPSYQKEKTILDAILNKDYKNEIFFYNSLQDELLKYFGSENILQLLERMGFNDDEAIEHALITKSLQNAQLKIDQQVQIVSDTRNKKDWFTINLPNNL